MRALLYTFLAFLLPATAFALPQIGQPAPDFVASSLQSKTVSPSQFLGKIVVLEWTNPGCPFVHKHYDHGNMQDLQAYAKSKGVVWLTINSSAKGREGNMSYDEARQYFAAQKLNSSHYIIDDSGEIGKLYGAKSTPHMFVIDVHGKLAYMGAIDNKSTPDAGSVPGADNYVRDAIDNLLAGKPVATASTQAYGCSVKYAE